MFGRKTSTLEAKIGEIKFDPIKSLPCFEGKYLWFGDQTDGPFRAEISDFRVKDRLPAIGGGRKYKWEYILNRAQRTNSSYAAKVGRNIFFGDYLGEGMDKYSLCALEKRRKSEESKKS